MSSFLSLWHGAEVLLSSLVFKLTGHDSLIKQEGSRSVDRLPSVVEVTGSLVLKKGLINTYQMMVGCSSNCNFICFPIYYTKKVINH